MIGINRIFLFGDSWIEGQGTYQFINSNNQLIEPHFENDNNLEKISRWRKENSWNKFVGEKTKCEVRNFARHGSDNYYQYSKLNSIINLLTKNDLVIFGFTSKLRDRSSIQYAYNIVSNNIYDSKLLSRTNPLNGYVAWEKISMEFCNYGYRDENIDVFTFTKPNEREFTERFIKDYFTSLHNDYAYEHIAQMNYYFYQERFKSLGLNIVFFDLFEEYVNPSYVSPNLNIDNDIYINYSKKTMNRYLIDYEINNITKNDISIWECGHRRPDLNGKIYHPNQHGYEIYVNYLFDKILSKKYKFNNI
jgi:hypothetical protein